MSANASSATVSGPPNTTALPLKTQLRRAERLKKLKYGALIAPLALFLLLTFLWPIGALLMRSVENPEVPEALPQTLHALAGWDRQALPGDAVFAALVADLTENKGSRTLAVAAKRLNMEEPGFRSLFMNSARKMPLEPGVAPRQALLEMDPQWGELATWQLIARNGRAYTDYFLLAALDMYRDGAGDITQADPLSSIFVDIFARTFWMSLIVTIWCLALGYPVAYLLATQSSRVSNLLMIFVLLPFWTSILVRVAAWIVLLQQGGLINMGLISLGIIDQPLQLVFNRIGVYIAMVHILLPFMILPLYSVMKGISPTYLRAAVSLGCPPFRSYWKVYFPMTVPGVAAGGLLVFIIAMGYYITPALLGSPKEQMASYFVAFYTNETTNWGMAAALSAVLLVATMILYFVYNRLVGSASSGAKPR
ncbi:ABC transporter permease [Candidatus Accumulibacter sp. ACC003]|jgi:putative spermidine/putrescine transport system permease protein|uniref:ABC transporter permease n=1 Tax=Candidatus Accumulibacter sp. ACC003 TaxID=2823334 RepID=UPI0025BFCB88|nr:ABC transporter permease [Candidatus Accumulibacter sp. ACC003]